MSLETRLTGKSVGRGTEAVGRRSSRPCYAVLPSSPSLWFLSGAEDTSVPPDSFSTIHEIELTYAEQHPIQPWYLAGQCLLRVLFHY